MDIKRCFPDLWPTNDPLCLPPTHRERPAAISIEIKSIDDTSNFDDFPESDILQPGSVSSFFGQNLGIIFLQRYFYMMCSAPKQRFKITPYFFLSVTSQCNGARLQIKGLGVPQLHIQTLWGSDSTRHHPHIHEGRKGLTRCNRGDGVLQRMKTDIYGHRVWAPEPRWCWRQRQQPLSINLTLITSYLGLLSRRKNRHKLGN